ncbi:MAG: hypothetical protein ACYSUK_03540 [Planctomycetota bacterium]|jgi:hypothetical protein
MKSDGKTIRPILIFAFLLFTLASVHAGLYSQGSSLYTQDSGLYTTTDSGLYTQGSSLYTPGTTLYPGSRTIRPEDPDDESGTYSGGDGSPENPFQIATPEDLNDVGNHPIDWDKNFIMVNNVNLSAYTGETFNMIGIYNDEGDPDNKPFTGVFDGNGYIISSFTHESVSNPPKLGFGLFAYISGPNAVVLDLTLENADVNAQGSALIGGIAGLLEEGSVINCSSENGQFSGLGNIGMLVGTSNGKIIGSYSNGKIIGKEYIDYECSSLGGIVGWNEGDIEYCRSNCEIIVGDDRCAKVGGLVGTNRSGTINDCFSVVNIETQHSSLVGGLIGQLKQGNVDRCYAVGDVSILEFSDPYGYCAGGLVAQDLGGDISNCYAIVDVCSPWIGGGLVGVVDEVTIENCYSAGQVSGDSELGGFVGQDSGGLYVNCFWDSDINPDVNGIGNLSSDPNVTGKTTAEMRTKSTFTDADWDFVGETINGPNDIWTIKEDVNYPQHVWPLVQYVEWDGVDFLDYSFFANHWLFTDCADTNDCNSTDLDFSGAVDTTDLNIFTNNWLFGK